MSGAEDKKKKTVYIPDTDSPLTDQSWLLAYHRHMQLEISAELYST